MTAVSSVDAPRVSFAIFLDCKNGPWLATATALIDGVGWVYGLRRDAGAWVTHRWLATRGVVGYLYADLVGRAGDRPHAELLARQHARTEGA